MTILNSFYEEFEKYLGEFTGENRGKYDMQWSRRRLRRPLRSSDPEEDMFIRRWHYIIPTEGVATPDKEQERIFIREFVARMHLDTPAEFWLSPDKYDENIKSTMMEYYVSGTDNKHALIYNESDDSNAFLMDIHKNIVKSVNNDLRRKRRDYDFTSPEPDLPAMTRPDVFD